MENKKPIFLAVLVGCACALFMFKSLLKVDSKEPVGNAIAIQIGVFTKKENAENLKDSFGGMILEDGGVYRVYYSILNNNENIEYMTDYLEKQGINYYLKTITVSDDLLYKSENYEALMSKTTKNDAKLTINDEILKMYGEVI